jgi:hypothetical protein
MFLLLLTPFTQSVLYNVLPMSLLHYELLQAVLEFRLSRGPEKWRNVYKALLVSFVTSCYLFVTCFATSCYLLSLFSWCDDTNNMPMQCQQ